MRAKIRRLAACLAIVLAVPLALLCFAFGLPAQYGETFLGGLPLKYDALRAAASPRIVLIGGSGTAFDYRCDLLEQELPGYSAVNFGLYAALGTTVMLDLARPQLRPGDIVIFSPELSAQTLSPYFNAEAMWQAADGHPELLAALGEEYLGALAGAFPAFAAAKARLYRTNSAPGGSGIYARASFNAWGDIESARRNQNEMPGGTDPDMPLLFNPELLSDDFVRKVNAFTDACEKKGVQVYFRFCPMNAAAATDGERARAAAFQQALTERLRCGLLGDVAGALMDAGWFYDSNFHLNSAGAVVNTAALAAELKELLGDDSPVRLALPAMPAAAEATLLSGDNRDEACFLYAPDGDALRITALTAAGRARTQLTLPVSHEGLPVTAFGADVFAGNAVIREITVQPNIRHIEDGSFAGCAALERLVLTSAAPASCSVSNGLLSGTDALVYVPAGSLSAYCTDYFWAVHATRLRSAEETETGGDVPEAAPSPESRDARSILYDGNGGALKRQDGDTLSLPMDSAHLRVNTLQGSAYFQREGYVLTGWNTAPDGSGQAVGLGSRIERIPALTLYAQWSPASPESDFLYEADGTGARILAYDGPGGTCTVPETLGGVPVRQIAGGAFRNAAFSALVLPSSLQTIEPGAFSGCVLEELWLFDSLRSVSDAALENCSGPATLHINAAVSPVYSGSYYDTFSDKFDRLLSVHTRPKLVLASGSSGRYGYDSAAISRAFPDYEVVNMGVYAYSNALPQLELIRRFTGEGDILLSAPEFDAVAEQFCVSDRLDIHFWAMMESNYDAVSLLDMRRYSGIFDSFADYQRVRAGMAGRSYSVSPANYDDDGNYYAFSTYNLYGDFILPRPNSERDERLRHNIADYTLSSFPAGTVESLNTVYETFLAQGVRVYFSYSPRNRSSLTEASTLPARQALDAYLRETLCVPVITAMEDSLYSGVYFWLIDSHLSTEGAALRTGQVIADLTAALAARP